MATRERDIDKDRAIELLGQRRYESSVAVIQELVANSYTACMIAHEQYGVPLDELGIEVDVRDGLRVSDNGVGIPREKYHEKMGTVANESETTGYHGEFSIGSLSVYTIADEFRVTTHSRETGESYAMLMPQHGKYRSVGGARSTPGTTISTDGQVDVSFYDLKQKMSELSRAFEIDILLKMPDDHVRYEGEGLSGMWEYEDELVHIVAGSDVRSVAYMSSLPVTTTSLRVPGFGRWQISYDVKSNDGEEWKGVELPQTTTDRERFIGDQDDFHDVVRWIVAEQVQEEMLKWVADKSIDDLDEDTDLWRIGCPEWCYDDSAASKLLYLGDKRIRFARETDDIESRAPFYTHRVWNAYLEHGEDVWVGKTMNNRRWKVLQLLNDDPVAGLIEKDRWQDEYPINYQDALDIGWSLLKEVPLDVAELEELGLEKDEIEEALSDPDAEDEQKVTTWILSYDGSISSTTMTRDQISESEMEWVVFGDNEEENMTNHRDEIVSPVVGCFTVQNPDNYRDLDNVVSLEEVVTEPSREWDRDIRYVLSTEDVDIEVLSEYLNLGSYRDRDYELVQAEDLNSADLRELAKRRCKTFGDVSYTRTPRKWSDVSVTEFNSWVKFRESTDDDTARRLARDRTKSQLAHRLIDNGDDLSFLEN